LIVTWANVHRFTKLFHYQIPDNILYTHIIKIFHLTLKMFLHIVKLKKITTVAYFNGILQLDLGIYLAIYRAALIAAQA